MLDLKIIPNFKQHIFLFFLQKVERPVPLFIFTYGYKKCPLKMERDKIPDSVATCTCQQPPGQWTKFVLILQRGDSN